MQSELLSLVCTMKKTKHIFSGIIKNQQLMFKNKALQQKADLQNLIRKTSKDTKQNKRSNLRNFINEKTSRHKNNHLIPSESYHKLSPENRKTNTPTESSYPQIYVEEFTMNPNASSLERDQFSPGTPIMSLNKSQTQQFLYKQEISLLKQYCEYIKAECKALKEELKKQKQKSNQKCELKHFEDKILQSIGFSTDLEIDGKQYGTMTLLTAAHTIELQESLNVSRQHGNCLINELECAYENMETLSSENKQISGRYQKCLDELKEKSSEVGRLQEQIKTINNQQEKNKVLLSDAEIETMLTKADIEEFEIRNGSLIKENEELAKEKSKILEICKRMPEKPEQGKILESNCLETIKQSIKATVQLHTVPLQQEISLIKQLLESQKKKSNEKQFNLQILMSSAQKTIFSLMEELRSSKKEANQHYMANLEQERSLTGLKSLYEVPEST